MRSAHALSLLALSITVACTVLPSTATPSGSPEDKQNARDALQRFFDLLNEEQYSEAVLLYGGSYDTMRDHNPSLLPTDLAALMRNACQINGAMCLRPRSITPAQADSSAEFLFQVEFQNKDGSLFIRGPCCGASPADQPPQSVFSYSVIRGPQGQFAVMDMPPYVP